MFLCRQWGEYSIFGEKGLYFLGGDQTKSLQGWDYPQPQRLDPKSKRHQSAM